LTYEIKFVVSNLADHRRHDQVVQMIDPSMHGYLGIICVGWSECVVCMIIRLSLVKDRKDSSFNAQATLLMLILLIDTPGFAF
jgi:hypothetical protein